MGWINLFSLESRANALKKHFATIILTDETFKAFLKTSRLTEANEVQKISGCIKQLGVGKSPTTAALDYINKKGTIQTGYFPIDSIEYFRYKFKKETVTVWGKLKSFIPSTNAFEARYQLANKITQIESSLDEAEVALEKLAKARQQEIQAEKCRQLAQQKAAQQPVPTSSLNSVAKRLALLPHADKPESTHGELFGAFKSFINTIFANKTALEVLPQSSLKTSSPLATPTNFVTPLNTPRASNSAESSPHGSLKHFDINGDPVIQLVLRP